MKLISFEAIKNQNISPYLCYQWVVEALLGKEQAMLPAKVSISPQEGIFYNTMPVLLPQIGYGGLKLVTRYPDRVPSLDSSILLYELTSGKNIALMDGNWITTMRTGAVAAHSVALLAKKDFSVLGIIGCGNTSRAALKVLLSIYPEKKMIIKVKKYKNQHEDFVRYFASHDNITFQFCESYIEVIDKSDVVMSSATYFAQDICPDEYFAPGVLVVPIHTRGFMNCDLFFDKIYADDRSHVTGFKYYDRFKHLAEVAEVISDKDKGRKNDDERILAYNIGIALHDIYYAAKIYSLIADSCENIQFIPPNEKFWL